MDDQLKGFLKRISARLALLLGGAVALNSSAAIAGTQQPSPPTSETTQVTSSGQVRRLPAKLILKKTNGGLKMIAQHSSHSSHASHASHASHSSHSSHASRAV
jgi:hypothetical protein